MVTYFAPGLRLFHEGQFEGVRTHVPAHLRRGPLELLDPDIAGFYDRLLAALRGSDALRHGAWSLISPQEASAGNSTWQGFIAYTWHGMGCDNYVLIVNYAEQQGQCYLRLPFIGLPRTRFRLIDVMGSEIYDRDGSSLMDPGLYIDLGPWRYNLFRLEPVAS
jgi:hypothetical protein